MCFVPTLHKTERKGTNIEICSWQRKNHRTKSLTWRIRSLPSCHLDECLMTCHIRMGICLQFPWWPASCRLPASPIYCLGVVTRLGTAWNISRVTSLQGTCFINVIYWDVKSAAGRKGRKRTGLEERRRKTETEGVTKTSRRFVTEMTRLWGGDEYETGVMRHLI